MISQLMQDALNEQINKEFASAYLYLSMSTWCDANNYSGAAHWMRAQFHEEQNHAGKMMGYLSDRGGKVVLAAIGAPDLEFASLQDVFEKTLSHEQYVTSLINALYAKAGAENDYASQAFLQYFVTEQVEEEKSAQEILDHLRKIGDKHTGLIMLDRHLASRE